MLDYFINFVGNLGHWGYLVIFLVVVLECQVVLGLVMPGESLVLVGGFFARHGGKAVFDTHFLHLLRSLMPFVAGWGGTRPMSGGVGVQWRSTNEWQICADYSLRNWNSFTIVSRHKAIWDYI